MHDLKYEEFQFLMTDFREELATLTYTKPVADAFLEQMRNVQRILGFPVNLVHTACKYERTGALAAHQITGGQFVFLSKDNLENPNTVKLWREQSGINLDILDKGEFESQRVISNAVASMNILKEIIARYTPDDWKELEAILISSLVSVYTALEIFTEDLWLAAVNYGDKVFFQNVMFPSSGNASQPKQISILAIEKFGYDLTHKMGDVLKESGKVNFASLSASADAYERAFGKCGFLSKNNLDFANCIVLEAIRNVLLHRNGRVDANFVMAVRSATGSSYHQSLPQDKQRLEITGRYIADFAGSALRLCDKLLEFVESKLRFSTIRR